MNTIHEKLEENLLEAKGMRLPQKHSRYFCKNEIKLPKKSLVIMCGTPGSGKTTLAQQICTQSNKAIHIDIDYIFDTTTQKLYPKAIYLTETDIDKIAEESFEKAYQKAEKALAEDNTIIWDNLGIFPTDRAEVLNKLKDKYTFAILVVVNCDKTEAVLRSIKRGDTQNRTDLIINTDMYLQLQLQNLTKYFIGFDEVYFIDGTQEVTVKEP